MLCEKHMDKDRNLDIRVSSDKFALDVSHQMLSQFVREAALFFRPVQKRKTNISIFTSLLTPTKQKEDA